MTFTLQHLAELLRAELQGDPSLTVGGIAPIEEAVHGEVSFVANKKYEKHLAGTKATAVIVSRETVVQRNDLALLRVSDPYIGFVTVLRLFHPLGRYAEPGIHPSAVIDPSATLCEDVTVAASAVIGRNVHIGKGTVVAEGVVLRDGASVGEDCLLYPNVSVLDRCVIGDRVIIHSGTTIGSDGFGFAPSGEKYEKIPQVGFVSIENDVEIGANCAIDRGTLGPTIIRSGVKLDNLIQIAHNVEIGENTVIAAQSGISGSTVLGKHVLIAGQVGVVGHIEIGENVTVGAQSGVAKSLQGPGKIFRGSPAREIHDELRLEAALRHLPDLIKTVREQERRIHELEELLAQQQERD
ncbi:MAG: UDP-3-O-(3-hydroxymyristoyl)glucosamine N-acyltransferase [Bacteroidia bacterium]|nr:UDP-3-O-(3-hydroxymyristoyl)glucosamine N-acyltransferase [Bacteroidia bacterium]